MLTFENRVSYNPTPISDGVIIRLCVRRVPVVLYFYQYRRVPYVLCILTLLGERQVRLHSLYAILKLKLSTQDRTLERIVQRAYNNQRWRWRRWRLRIIRGHGAPNCHDAARNLHNCTILTYCNFGHYSKITERIRLYRILISTAIVHDSREVRQSYLRLLFLYRM